jgi:hypothetical protein
MTKALVALGTAAVAAVAAGIALGAIPGNGGVISGCYHKQLGVLRVIDVEGTPAKSCTGWERPLVWSQTGPQGPAGPQGPKGDLGESGVSGYEVVESDDDKVLGVRDVTEVVTVACPDDKVAIGGGVESLNTSGNPYRAAVIGSTPTANGTGWRTTVARIVQDDTTIALVTGYAVCVEAS